MVAVTGRWGRRDVLVAAPVVQALHEAIAAALGNTGGAGGNAIEHPVGEAVGQGCVGIMDDEGIRLCASGGIRPRQWRRGRLLADCVTVRNSFPMAERGARNPQLSEMNLH